MGKSEIGSRIADLRKKAGLSQEALGEKIGIGQNALSRYEIGTASKIPVDDIERLADVFGVSCDYLIRGFEPENVDIGEKTGLSNESIERLAFWEKSRGNTFLDYMISSETFYGMMLSVNKSIEYMGAEDKLSKQYDYELKKGFDSEMEHQRRFFICGNESQRLIELSGYHKYEAVECFKKILDDYVKSESFDSEVQE